MGNMKQETHPVGFTLIVTEYLEKDFADYLIHTLFYSVVSDQTSVLLRWDGLRSGLISGIGLSRTPGCIAAPE